MFGSIDSGAAGVNGWRTLLGRRGFFVAFLLLGLPLMPKSAGALDVPVEAPLPAGCVPAGEPGRYRINRSYEEVLDFYRKLFHQTGGVRWRFIVNQPSIRARHIASLKAATRWSGINVSDHNGETGIYVLSRVVGEASEAHKSRTYASP